MEKMIYGYVPSKMDGTELKFEGDKTLEIPEAYSYVRFLPSVLDQGNNPICVTCACSAYINWNVNVDDNIPNKTDHKVALFDIYAAKTNEGDGMTFKDALHYLKHHGVKTDVGIEKIERYALVGGEESLKRALISNGPCVGAFIVRDPNCGREFWNGNGNLGGHAISIVGYDREGFIIRNSWGSGWANNGYTKLKYKDFNKLLEIWTIIG